MALAPIGQRNFSAACVGRKSATITTLPARTCFAMRKRLHGVRTTGACQTAIKSTAWRGWRWLRSGVLTLQGIGKGTSKAYNGHGKALTKELESWLMTNRMTKIFANVP